MQLKLKLFSSLMEYLPQDAKGNTIEITVAGTNSCIDLIKRYKIPQESIQVVMVNGEFVPPESRNIPLSDGDTISIWPSIQGG